MVSEGWSLNDALAFVEEYKLSISVQDNNGDTIPKEEYDKYKDATIISQSRPAGDTVITGITLKVSINETYKKEDNNEDNE